MAYFIAILFLGLSGGAVALGTVEQHSFWSLIFTFAALLSLLFGIGKLVGGRSLAVLINERNVMSLSRLQTALWTMLLLAGFLNRVLWAIHWNVTEPLAVGVPERLWWLAGISTVSLVGTPLILSGKAHREPSDKSIITTAAALGPKTAAPDSNHPSPDLTAALDSKPAPFDSKTAALDPKNAAAASEMKGNAIGSLFRNPNKIQASFLDVFQGDEVGDAGQVDLAKLQMFFFTLVLAGSYLAMLINLTKAGGKNLPDFDTGMVTLLGISHAGYLGSKGVDHSASRPGV